MGQNHGKGSLDLGLSAILEAAKDPVAAPAPAAVAPIDMPSAKPAPVIERNEFESLADHAQWPRLLKLCEDRIAQNGADITEPRLWWITSHLHTNGLPVSFLTAPLEAATKHLDTGSDGKLKALASGTLAATAGALEKSGDGSGAVSLLERAIALGGKQDRELAATIDREISRLRDQSGLSSRQIDERNAKIKKLQTMRPKGVQSAAERTLSAVPRKSREKSKEGKREKESGLALAKDFAARNRRIFGGVAAGIAVLLLLLWTGSTVYRYFTVQTGLPALEARNAGAPQMKLAELSRMDNVSAFDGLYYDLKENVDAPARSMARPVARVSDTVARTPREKETINLSEPRESAEMQQALQQPDKSSPDANSEILFGGTGAAPKNPVAQVASTGSQPRNQNFTGNKIFRILARTKILAQPSYQTDVLGMLSPGERVSAEGRVDSWLRIRSTSGRIGFIFAQDAEPAA